MKEYRHGAHSVFELHLPLVWTTKYRKRVLAGEVGLRVRELIRGGVPAARGDDHEEATSAAIRCICW